jgi:transcriptional antiterminator RfaH
MNWHAIQTKPHQEQAAEFSIQRLGVETFSPQLKQDKVIRRVRQTVIRPLFSGYLFARFHTDARYRAIHYARGVQRVVTLGAEPAIVDDAIIETIRSRMHDGYVTTQPPVFKPGQTVRILEGPLQGLEAMFEREMSDDRRVILLLQALACNARVVIDRDHVETVQRSECLVSG